MTNTSFIFSFNSNKYIFRIPGNGSNTLINRSHEFEVYKKLKTINLGDEVIFFSPDTGYKISKYIDNARKCNPHSKHDICLVMHLLRKFHNTNFCVNWQFDLFDQLKYYESLSNQKNNDYIELREKVFSLKNFIDRNIFSNCLCHLDYNCDNLLFSNKCNSQEKIQILDWEYAIMQDPHLDIAMFCCYSHLDKDEIDGIIDAYFDDSYCPLNIRAKIYSYISVSGLLWYNWCLFKSSFSETFGTYQSDQYKYAKDYYKYALTLIQEYRL